LIAGTQDEVPSEGSPQLHFIANDHDIVEKWRNLAIIEPFDRQFDCPYCRELQHSEGYSGAYVRGQQMVFRPDGPGTSTGATIWGAWTFNSKQVISPVPVLSGAGVSYMGLIGARKSDTVSIGLICAEASKYAPSQNTEELLEINYQWAHSRYLTVIPHGQFQWKQQSREGHSAAILGIELALTF
jgi:hypothetical protein